MIGAARGELLDVGREEDPGYVFLVCTELSHGHELGALEGLYEGPHEDVALQSLGLYVSHTIRLHVMLTKE